MTEAASITKDPWAEDEEQPTGAAPKPPADGSTVVPGADAPTGTAETDDGATKPPEEAKVAQRPAAKKVAAAATKTAAPATAKKTTAPVPGPPPSAPGPRIGLGSTLSEQTTYPFVLWYGPEGTGKTTNLLRMTRLCKENQRVILIDAEGGAKIEALRQRGVDVSKIELFPRVEDGGPAALSFELMFDLADELAKPGMAGPDGLYIGWGWDSGSEITRRMLDQVTREARAKDARLGKERGRFQVNLEDHGVASAMLRELLRKFKDLPMYGGITALERRDVDNDTGKVKYGPAMAPAMANDTAGLVDIVGFCTVDIVGGEEIRSARFTPIERRRAKDRFGMLPTKLADPYYDRILGYVKGDLTRDNDPVQAHVRELAEAAAAAIKKEN